MALALRSTRTFYRACPQHLCELTGHITASGGEIVRCREGHACREWYIMDHAGSVIGAGRVGGAGILRSGFLDKGETDPMDQVIGDRPCGRRKPNNVVHFRGR